jgi:hypothetical protein
MTLSGSLDDTKLPVFQANATFQDAFLESRDLSFFLISAVVPVIIVVGLILFTGCRGRWLGGLSLLCGVIVLLALIRLLHDLVYDIAGYPDYKLPVWAVLYSILYIVEGFTFLFFGLHLVAPQQHYIGIAADKLVTTGFIDCLYLSLARTFAIPPEASFQAKSQLARFLPVVQGGLMMFLNIVIITKFVTSF